MQRNLLTFSHTNQSLLILPKNLESVLSSMRNFYFKRWIIDRFDFFEADWNCQRINKCIRQKSHLLTIGGTSNDIPVAVFFLFPLQLLRENIQNLEKTACHYFVKDIDDYYKEGSVFHDRTKICPSLSSGRQSFIFQ